MGPGLQGKKFDVGSFIQDCVGASPELGIQWGLVSIYKEFALFSVPCRMHELESSEVDVSEDSCCSPCFVPLCVLGSTKRQAGKVSNGKNYKVNCFCTKLSTRCTHIFLRVEEVGIARC